MGDPVTMLAISGAATGLGIVGREQAGAAQIRELENQKAQAHIQSAQQSIADTQKLESILSAESARLGATGTSALSPSFVTLQKDSFQQYNQDESRRKLQLQYIDSSIGNQIGQTRFGTFADIAGSVAGFAFSAANTFNLNSGVGKAASFEGFSTSNSIKQFGKNMFKDNTDWSLF